MRTKAVFFDLGGTLLVMRRDRIISKILSDSGYPSTPEQVHSAYFSAEPTWLLSYGDKKLTGDETEEAYRQLDAMIFRILFPAEPEETVGLASNTMRRQWGAVEKSVPLELFPDVVPTLERLKSDGYALGLVSNAPPDTVDVINALGLPKYLPVIVVSGVVGVSKPNPEIFRIALRGAHCEPSESIHVGDIFEADVLGARNAGMTGVLIDRAKAFHDFDCPKIAGLEGVYDFLE